MSSDLPDSDHYSGSAQMARKLVTYLDDPNVIREAIRREFSQVPTERTIRILRAEYLDRRNRPDTAPAKPYEGFDPFKVSDVAARASTSFLARLEAERAISARRQLEAVKSPYQKLFQARLPDTAAHPVIGSSPEQSEAA